MIAQAIYNIILSFIDLFILLCAGILAFDCIWRVERRFKTFMKLLTAALVPFVLRNIAIIIGYTEFSHWTTVDQGLSIVGSFLLLASFIEMYRILRTLDHEDPQN